MGISKLLIIRDIRIVIDNTAIANKCYKHVTLNKSHNIKISVLQAFVIT